MLAQKTGKMNISVASTEFGFIRSKTVMNEISNDAGKQFDTSKFAKSNIGRILNWQASESKSSFRNYPEQKWHHSLTQSIFSPCPQDSGCLNNVIHWINHYPVDSVACFGNTYPLESDLSFEQLVPGD